jgi:hypothetical protein
MATACEAQGLADLVKVLKGSAFRDVNKELRQYARQIANDMIPAVQAGVRASRAPQAAAMAATVRPHSDRVPVVVVGKVNPKFSTKFRGGDTKRRRGAIALGVVSGPAGKVNYYKIPRDRSWGPLGDAIAGPIMRDAEIAYLRLYIATLKHHGLDARS